MRLFFYGTLLDADVQAMVLDRSLAEDELKPALLRHFRRVYVAGRAYPMLLPHRGGRVEGAVVERLSQDDLTRIQIYEGDAYRFERHMVCLIGADGRPAPEPVSAWLFRGAPATRPSTRDWRLDLWQERDKMAYLRELRESAIADRSARRGAHG